MLQNSKLAFSFQASAFEPVGNLYAPYYRQADAAYTLTLPLAEQAKVVGGIPATDGLAAFDYYIQNFNQGRPFILAGHSQGSNVLLYLLGDYLKAHPEVQARMIAAYVIGYSITPEYLAKNPHLKFARGRVTPVSLFLTTRRRRKWRGKIRSFCRAPWRSIQSAGRGAKNGRPLPKVWVPSTGTKLGK